MSVEKEAAFLDSMENAVKRRMRNANREVVRALPFIRQSSRDAGISMTRGIVDGLAGADAFGARKLSRGLRSLDRGINKADTWIGAMVRGKSNPNGSFASRLWHNLWTKKDKVRVHVNSAGKLVPGVGKNIGKVLYKEIERPSITKPLVGAGALATGYLAQMKGTELLDKLRSRPKEQDEGGAQ